MRVLIINSVCGTGSTGKICADLADEFKRDGHVVRIAYGRGSIPSQYKKDAIRIGNEFGVRLSVLHTRLTDRHGFSNQCATRRFLRWASNFDPDLVWLHNIHGYYINVEMLFDWIKMRPHMKVNWTLHDCWAFTGHCAFFSMAKCDQWSKHCVSCPQTKAYPKSMWKDRCEENFARKKKAFCNVRDMTLVTPSYWMADLVKKSFLAAYPIEVVYNKINREAFQPTPSNFRNKYGLKEKRIILGVANVWDERKGLKDFWCLREMLDDSYVIVLVGLNKRQLRTLPPGIIGIERTSNIYELAGIYTTADIFVNPSKEETFGMTTVEAYACGTPAIVYRDTACEEIVKSMCCGVAVEQNVDSIYTEILRMTTPGDLQD